MFPSLFQNDTMLLCIFDKDKCTGANQHSGKKSTMIHILRITDVPVSHNFKYQDLIQHHQEYLLY